MAATSASVPLQIKNPHQSCVTLRVYATATAGSSGSVMRANRSTIETGVNKLAPNTASKPTLTNTGYNLSGNTPLLHTAAAANNSTAISSAVSSTRLTREFIGVLFFEPSFKLPAKLNTRVSTASNNKAANHLGSMCPCANQISNGYRSVITTVMTVRMWRFMLTSPKRVPSTI